jgi:hypothetical protein
VACGSSGCQAARVFVDQAAQDGFSVDPLAVEIGNGEHARVAVTREFPWMPKMPAARAERGRYVTPAEDSGSRVLPKAEDPGA